MTTARATAPRVSVVVALSADPLDARRCLETLCRQRNVSPEDYEIIGIGKRTAIDRTASSIGAAPNLRWVVSPDDADAEVLRLDTALSAACGPILGFFDRLPLVTPRIIEQAIAAATLFPRPVVAVPAYRLGRESATDGTEEQETILSRVDWATDPYDLFEVARLAPTNERGYLSSLHESHSFFCMRAQCDELLDDPKIEVRAVNDLFAHLLRDARNRLVALGGEGAFEPAPTKEPPRANAWRRTDRQPTLFGVVPGQSMDFFASSIASSAMHEALARERGSDEWPSDPRRSGIVTAPNRARGTPKLSIALVAFNMPEQLENTLYSLSAAHQWNVSEDDYEIIVVENQSPNVLGHERATRLGANVRYHLREEPGVSPAPALNFAVSQARGELVGLLIDGARMATPRVVEHVLLAANFHDRPFIAVPGFHLGPGRQHLTSLEGYDEAAERELLERTDWKHFGYRLFEVSCFDEATNNGFLNPLLEATYLFTTRACFSEVGGFDERFDLEGGGDVNLDLFERLSRLPDTRYVVLWGEGNFHQYHRGVSTTAGDRERKLQSFRDQYDRIRGRRFSTFEREPWLLGTSCGRPHERFTEAASLGRLRFGIVRDEGRKEWENG